MYLDYQLDGGSELKKSLVSLNHDYRSAAEYAKKTVCALPAFDYYRMGLNNAATSRILVNPAVIPIL